MSHHNVILTNKKQSKTIEQFQKTTNIQQCRQFCYMFIIYNLFFLLDFKIIENPEEKNYNIKLG